MKPHLDEADLLEILYLNETNAERSRHLDSCTRCHERLAGLRTEIEEDRVALTARVEAKPEQFWLTQRDEILSRATARHSRSAWLRVRVLVPAIVIVLIVAGGVIVTRVTNPQPTIPAQVAVPASSNGELFDETDLRGFDPWESDELESFHQIVQWEEWLEEDEPNLATPEEES